MATCSRHGRARKHGCSACNIAWLPEDTLQQQRDEQGKAQHKAKRDADWKVYKERQRDKRFSRFTVAAGICWVVFSFIKDSLPKEDSQKAYRDSWQEKQRGKRAPTEVEVKQVGLEAAVVSTLFLAWGIYAGMKYGSETVVMIALLGVGYTGYRRIRGGREFAKKHKSVHEVIAAGVLLPVIVAWLLDTNLVFSTTALLTAIICSAVSVPFIWWRARIAYRQSFVKHSEYTGDRYRPLIPWR